MLFWNGWLFCDVMPTHAAVIKNHILVSLHSCLVVDQRCVRNASILLSPLWHPRRVARWSGNNCCCLYVFVLDSRFFLPHRPLQGHGAVGKLCAVGKPLVAGVGDEGDDDYIKNVESQLTFLGKLGVLKLLQANMHLSHMTTAQAV